MYFPKKQDFLQTFQFFLIFIFHFLYFSGKIEMLCMQIIQIDINHQKGTEI